MPNGCPPGTFLYIIRPGDTYFSLARRYNITVPALISANPLINPNFLLVGQRICIPKQRVSPTCPERNFYTIRPDDTLYRIARTFSVSLDDLLEANPGINPDRLFVGQVICIPKPRENTSVFTNADYNVTFRYPSNWSRVDDTRYEGENGFFQVSAISSEGTIDEVCRNEATQRLNPYGSNPQTQRTTIDGQEACFVFPSADQPVEMKEQAALIVRYPSPVEIQGETYNFFILWADKDFIRQIAGTVRFTNIQYE